MTGNFPSRAASEKLLPSAIAIAILASVESLLSAVVADRMARTAQKHDPDREILGQGLANLVSPIMGGIPATPMPGCFTPRR